jgi:hypothetical protein
MRLAVAAIAVVLGLAAPAAASPLRLGASVMPPLVESAAGRVVWQPDAGSIRVLDLGARAPARAFALPAGCRLGDAGALRADRLVLTCSGAPRLLDLASGASGPVPGAAQAGIGGPASGVIGAGAVWGEGWAGDATVFFRLDGAAAERGQGTATQVPDLDAPGLWRELCAPLERTPASDEFERAFLPYAYAPPLGLSHRAFEYRPLRVDRCGARPLRLSRCPRACTAVHLGAGSIAWREHGSVRLYRAAGGRRARWRAGRFGDRPEAYPTRDHVVVATGSYGDYVVWSVRR